MASTYELIETTTLASSASSVTFTSITQDYRDLVLVLEAYANTGNASTYIRLNGDTGTNYFSVAAFGNGSSASSFSNSSLDWLYWSLASGGTSTPLMGIVQFLDYSATDKHKSQVSRFNRADSASGMSATRWANTSAISTILVYEAGGNDFASGSTFSLYGIAA